MGTADVVTPFQIITLAVFIGGLLLLWLYVQKNRDGLAGKMGKGKRITVSEVAALSPTDRALILAVDGREFLVLRSKGTPPVLTELGRAVE